MAGDILNKDNLRECIKCGYDTFQSVLEPDSTTQCLHCGTTLDGLRLGTRQTGTATKSDCLRMY